jgi:hypothetical protein
MRSLIDRRSIVAVAVVLLSVSGALAAVLPPGGSVVPGATPSPTGATQLATTGAVAFNSLVDPAAYSGTLTSTVYNNDANNPFGANKLTFTYLLSNNANSRDAIERMVTNNFQGYQVDVAINGAGRAPSTADRSASGVGVGWDWTNAPAIIPGTSSTLLVVHSDATQFVPSTDNIINTFPALVASLGPSPIPEPATLGLAGFGLLALARRRGK